MIIDTHSHLQFSAYDPDREEVIKRTKDNHIVVINVGTKYATSKGAVDLAENHSQEMYAAIGLHPMYAGSEFIKIKHDPSEEEKLEIENSFDKEKYKALAQSRRVVAIGEIGLDYYYKPKTAQKLQEFKEKQKQVFIQQLDLASELNLPVILHCRMAHQDLLEILKLKVKSQKLKVWGVVHCFTGTIEEMKSYVQLGFYIGINGIIFKLPLDEVIKNCPLDHLVVETDCPYLTPSPEEAKRNEPIFITHTIERIAQLKGLDFEQIIENTTRNAKQLFGI